MFQIEAKQESLLTLSCLAVSRKYSLLTNQQYIPHHHLPGLAYQISKIPTLVLTGVLATGELWPGHYNSSTVWCHWWLVVLSTLMCSHSALVAGRLVGLTGLDWLQWLHHTTLAARRPALLATTASSPLHQPGPTHLLLSSSSPPPHPATTDNNNNTNNNTRGYNNSQLVGAGWLVLVCVKQRSRAEQFSEWSLEPGVQYRALLPWLLLQSCPPCCHAGLSSYCQHHRSNTNTG